MTARRGHTLLSVLFVLAFLQAASSFRVRMGSEAVLPLEDLTNKEEDVLEADSPIDNLRVIPTSEISMDDAEDSPGTMEVAPEDIPGTTETAEDGRAIDNFRDNFHQDPFTEKETRQGTRKCQQIQWMYVH